MYICNFFYPHFKYICNCICFECKRFDKEYMRIICSCPKFGDQTPNPFFERSSITYRESRSLLIHRLLSSLREVHVPHWETHGVPSDHKQICIFFLLCFNLTDLHQDFHYFCQANANQILIHASLNGVFHLFTCWKIMSREFIWKLKPRRRLWSWPRPRQWRRYWADEPVYPASWPRLYPPPGDCFWTWWSTPVPRCWWAKRGKCRRWWPGWGNPGASGSPGLRCRWRSGSDSPWKGREGRRRPAARWSPISRRRCGRSPRLPDPCRCPRWPWRRWTCSSGSLQAQWSLQVVSQFPGSLAAERLLRPHPNWISGSWHPCWSPCSPLS